MRTANERLADDPLEGEDHVDERRSRRSSFEFPDVKLPASTSGRIEIRDPEGNIEIRELSKSQPFSIGRHATNDVVIDEDGIASLHGRISGTARRLN